MHADAEPPPAEEWRPVEGFPGYELSSLGRVKGKRVPFLRPAVVGGYPSVTLYAPGRRRTFKLHALVCAAFRGPRPPGREAAHLNGVRSDCRAGNLAWASPAENARHKREHKTWPAGEANPAAKITAAQARAIRIEYDALPHRTCGRVPRGARVEIASRYGVSRWLVTKIANRGLWRGA